MEYALHFERFILSEELVRKTLPVKHFHIVFTVPHVLNGICLSNNRSFYDLLFQAV